MMVVVTMSEALNPGWNLLASLWRMLWQRPLKVYIRPLCMKSPPPPPIYRTAGSVGADLCAASGGTIEPGNIQCVGTGWSIALPTCWEAQIRPRSGLAAAHGVTVLNSPGTIDSDYRGEILVLLINHGKEPFPFEKGDRIAQMVIAPVRPVKYILVDTLEETQRGSGGFGSTGR